MTAIGARKTNHMGAGEPGRLRSTIYHIFIKCNLWKEVDIKKNKMGY